MKLEASKAWKILGDKETQTQADGHIKRLRRYNVLVGDESTSEHDLATLVILIYTYIGFSSIHYTWNTYTTIIVIIIFYVYRQKKDKREGSVSNFFPNQLKYVINMLLPSWLNPHIYDLSLSIGNRINRKQSSILRSVCLFVWLICWLVDWLVVKWHFRLKHKRARDTDIYANATIHCVATAC